MPYCYKLNNCFNYKDKDVQCFYKYIINYNPEYMLYNKCMIIYRL